MAVFSRVLLTPELPAPANAILVALPDRTLHRVAFGKTQLEHGKESFEYSMHFTQRLRGGYRIAQAEVATHNHFVLDRGGKVLERPR